ncbi:hypothetical protein CDAR_467941 [Caerostris darwini]|uniref:Uncharacterized protein n=1 Tax=Caerostris darwini TaxID=1538125 RepID=A0AAV4V4E4_9ARAC|nr:hypothetical protein CDAR_467941 [Caerostris darwini]
MKYFKRAYKLDEKTSPSSLLPPVPAISTTAFICSTTSTRHLNSSPTASILPAHPHLLNHLSRHLNSSPTASILNLLSMNLQPASTTRSTTQEHC